MAPVALGVQIAKTQLLALAGQDLGDADGDLAGDELETAPLGFVVEQDAVTGMRAVGLAVVAGEIESGHFADAVSGARVEAGGLGLGDLFRVAEHLARSGEVETALRGHVLEGRQDEMGAVDIGIQGGKLVVEGIAHEALGGQVVALVGEDVAKDLVDARKALEGGGVEVKAVEQVGDPAEPPRGVLQGNPADDAVDFVPFGQQQLRQEGTVLAGDAGD